jgi:hypothetical protein
MRINVIEEDTFKSVVVLSIYIWLMIYYMNKVEWIKYDEWMLYIFLGIYILDGQV